MKKLTTKTISRILACIMIMTSLGVIPTSKNVEAADNVTVDAQISALTYAINARMPEDGGYSVEDIEVSSDDGWESAFVPGGSLNKIILKKNSDAVLNGKVYVGIYNDYGVLEDVIVKTVADNTASETVEVDFSSDPMTFPADIRAKNVRVFLWGQNYNPLMSAFEWENLSNWKVYYDYNNGTKIEIAPDSMPLYKADGEIYVGAKYFLNIMGITLEKYGDKFYAESCVDTSKYIEFAVGSKTVKTGSGNVQLVSPVQVDENGFELLPFSLLESVFDCGITEVNDMQKYISVTFPDNLDDVTYDSLSAHGLSATYKTGPSWANYELSGVDTSEVESVDVWYKQKLSAELASMNNLEYNLEFPTRYWQKANSPALGDDGVYRGSMPYLKLSTTYSIKFVLTMKNGQKKTATELGAFKTSSYKTEKTDVLYDADTLTLKATYENIGYYVDYDNYEGAASCTVEYKWKNDTEWSEAYTPYKDETNKQFRGSIVNLEDNKTYTVRTTIKDAEGNTLETQEQSITTWKNNPNTKTIKLDEIVDSLGAEYDAVTKTIKEAIQFSNYKGSSLEWIKIDCSGWTVDAGYNTISAVNVDTCQNVIIDGLTIKGGYKCGVAVSANCYDVRLVRCDISKFGKVGALKDETGKPHRDGSIINYDAGIWLIGARGITVERCYIHDPVTKTNPWNYINKDGADLKPHPSGVSGIYLSVDTGCVIRYNDIIGSEEHRWNDGIEGLNNSYYTGGPARNTDIYGNTITYGQDDGIELDGGQMNVRVYKNKIEQFYCAVSLVANRLGPSYIFNNLFTNMGTETTTTGKALKSGGAEGNSSSYIFNNTFMLGVISENTSMNGSNTYNFVTRNNIFVNTGGGKCYENKASGAINDNDYDFCYGRADVEGYTNGGKSIIYSPDDFYKDNVYDEAGIVDYNKQLFNIEQSGECYQKGTRIPNFCEIELPNIGALQTSDDFLPYRPVGFKANKYGVVLSGSGTGTDVVDISGIEGPYTIYKSDDMSWLTVNGTQNGSDGLKLSFEVASGTGAHAGTVLVRLESGYSIPINVKCQ